MTKTVHKSLPGVGGGEEGLCGGESNEYFVEGTLNLKLYN